MKKIIPLFASLAFLSCKKENNQTPDNKTTNNDTVVQTVANEPVAKTDSLSVYVSQINNNRQKAITALKTASATEANKIYERLVAENTSLITKMSAMEAKFLEEFYTHFSGGEDQTPDAVLNQKSRTLKEGNLEFWEIGEGYAEIRTEADYYKNIFDGKVTQDYNQYINLLAEDNKELWQGDAAIAISWENLGKRVINWENFLNKYPASNFRKNAEENFALYRYGFLIGLDNTPVVDIISNTMDAEARKAFEAFVKQYPESPTSVYAKMLLNNVNNIDKVSEQVRIDF